MKAPYPGMHQDELIAAMGPPQMWIAEQGPARSADGRLVSSRGGLGERQARRQPSPAATQTHRNASRGLERESHGKLTKNFVDESSSDNRRQGLKLA